MEKVFRSPLGLFCLLVRTYQNTSSFTVNVLYRTIICWTILRSGFYTTYIRRVNGMYAHASYKVIYFFHFFPLIIEFRKRKQNLTIFTDPAND